METAKEMTRESLPIKCLEAVILGMYPLSLFASDYSIDGGLTLGLSDILDPQDDGCCFLGGKYQALLRIPFHFHHLELNEIRAWLLGPSSV